jgi:FtsP/CotA-like multicopper oxidase with cupredoxin domain
MSDEKKVPEEAPRQAIGRRAVLKGGAALMALGSGLLPRRLAAQHPEGEHAAAAATAPPAAATGLPARVPAALQIKAAAPGVPRTLSLFAQPGPYAGGQPLAEIPHRMSKDGRLDVDLQIRYADYSLDTGAEKLPVHLRSFVDPTLRDGNGGQIVGPWGPTLRIKPSDRLTVTLHNRLPPMPHQDPSPDCKFPPKPGDHNYPHDFNNTNLHTHGLHVSPYEDDVLREVPPTISSRYHYELDRHPPGTHWYHPHVHGSTGMQVSSGMAGALIVEAAHHEFPEFPSLPERVMVFNQLVFRKVEPPPYVSESFDYPFLPDVPFPVGTTINGQVKPVIEIEAGDIERWRLVNAGFESTIRFVVQNEANRQEVLELHQVAVDGIFLPRPRRTRDIAMGPGNRVDLLFQALKPGVYRLLSQQYEPEYEYDLGEERPIDLTKDVYLATVHVLPRRRRMAAPALPTKLPDSGYRITGEPVGTREVRFTLPRVPGENDACPLYWRYEWGINGKRYVPTDVPQRPVVGTVEDWHVTADPFVTDDGSASYRMIHPFHIHVNPFLVLAINGKKLLTPMWKDAILLESSDEGVHLRTKYERFTGDFVMHCHILVHEDVGMMQRVRIVEPGDHEEA